MSLLANILRCLCLCIIIEKGSWNPNNTNSTNPRRKIKNTVYKKVSDIKKKTKPENVKKPDWLKEWTISKGWVHNKSHLLELGTMNLKDTMETKNYEILSETSSVSSENIEDLLSLGSNIEINEFKSKQTIINANVAADVDSSDDERKEQIQDLRRSSVQDVRKLFMQVSENYRENFPDTSKKYANNDFSLPVIYREQLLSKEKESSNVLHYLWNYVKAKRRKKISSDCKYTVNELYNKDNSDGSPEISNTDLKRQKSNAKTNLGKNIALYNTLNDKTNLHEDTIYECSEENSNQNSLNNIYYNPVYSPTFLKHQVYRNSQIVPFDRRSAHYQNHLSHYQNNIDISRSKNDKYVIRHIRVRIMLSLRLGRIQKVKQYKGNKRGAFNAKNKINKKAVEEGDDMQLKVARMHDEQRRIGNGRTSIKIQNMRYGRLNVLRWLLWEAESREEMPALEKSSNNTTLALHYAAARGCLDCVRLLVDSSPELSANTQMDNDVTPVYLAAQEGHLDVLKFLVLEAGGSLYVRAKDGMAPIHAASQMGCLNCVKWMIQEQGVDPNLRDGDGATPLHFAASRGHLETVRWLLKHGARLSLDKYGKSPINDAAENQQVECLNVLVQHGTTPDYQGTVERTINGTICSCTRRGDKVKRGNSIGSDCSTCKPKPTTNTNNNNNNNQNLEPFYLHPPLSERPLEPPHAPENGLYVNPMSKRRQSASNSSDSSSASGGSAHAESFYLHDPQEVIYNRVKDLFETNQQQSLSALTVKVEVHSSSSGAGSDENLSSSDLSERSGDHENDYEDIYLVREESSNNKLDQNNNNNLPQSRDSGSHSRTGSVSSSNSGCNVVVNLSHNSTEVKQQIEQSIMPPMSHGEQPEKTKLGHRHSSPPKSASPNTRKLKRATSVPVEISPPPPPPLPERGVPNFEDDEPRGAECVEIVEEPTLKPSDIVKGMCRSMSALSARRLNSSCSDLTIVSLDAEEVDKHSGPNLVNKQRVLPFVPPAFPGSGESNNLIKPSEYLRSISDKRTFVSSGRSTSESEDNSNKLENKKQTVGPGPPPPPLPDFSVEPGITRAEQALENKKKQNQPLSAISIQDLNSVQLRRTDKMIASKTFSAPTRSMSLQCLQSEPFLAQKTDLIAELKMSRDITGIKKMKIEKAKTEESKEKELLTEISRQFTTTKFVEKVPEKDNTGNIIPAWKRQMLAKKAAEKAKKELEEQMLREAEEKRLQAIPQWKRQLILKKEEAESKMRSTLYTPKVVDEYKVNKLHESTDNFDHFDQKENKEDYNNNNDDSIKFEQFNDNDQSDEEPPNIIPWRAQLRKTNSKLNLLD